MRPLNFSLILSCAATVFALSANAAPVAALAPAGVVYDVAVTTPEDFLGFGLGERPIPHHAFVAYLQAVAAASPRLTVETIGKSHEGRPILLLVATSPDNHARLDEIKAAHKARLEEGGAPPASDLPAPNLPAVVWLNYGVHGAESSGMDAAIPTVYHLAAATGEDMERTLEETVIVIVAIFNPDGHSRRVDHVTAFAGETPVTDPAHAQHDLWMEARTNHYWFDLNRDWLLLTQPESRAWIGAWHDWKPLVSADFHEMGSEASYYFHPGEPRRRHPLIPAKARSLAGSIAEHHAAWLDAAGELYTSEEGFDNFYIGKGSTYPYVNGSIGFLFEAGAARGGEVETSNGPRTYEQNIRIHFNTSLTTIAGARANLAALQAYQAEFFASARKSARENALKAWVFTTDGDEARRDAFAELLRRHDIRVYSLAREVTVGGRVFRAGESFIVPTGQSQATMLRGVFDRLTAFEEAVFYDVSGWTLPLAYDLDYAALDGVRYQDALLGPAFEAPAPNGNVADLPKGAYGYIFDWDDYYAPRALYRFLGADAKARVSLSSKTINVGAGNVGAGGEAAARAFRQGAIFVPLAGQTISPDAIHAIARTAAREDRVDIFPVVSGDAAAGVGDLGGFDGMRTLTKPSVLVLFDDGPMRHGAGEIWHLLDSKMRVPTSLQHKSRLAGLNLSKYTHLILPNGEEFALTEEDRLRIESWTLAGGVLIAVQEAAHWAQASLFLPPPPAAPPGQVATQAPGAAPAAVVETKAGEPDEDPTERVDYASKAVHDAEHFIGGALFESDLDTTHPIAFAHRDRRVASLKQSPVLLTRPDDPFATVAQYTPQPVLSGYASQRRIEELAGSPMLTATRQGAGAAIYFADAPAFRATFPGTERLLLNAVFFGLAFDAAPEPVD